MIAIEPPHANRYTDGYWRDSAEPNDQTLLSWPMNRDNVQQSNRSVRPNVLFLEIVNFTCQCFSGRVWVNCISQSKTHVLQGL